MSEPVEVLITLPFPEDLVSELHAVSPRLHITVRPAPKPDEIPPQMWEKVEVLYTNSVLPAPDQVPRLRWIQLHWAGIDSLLDAPLLNTDKVAVTTLSGASASQMAEYVLMMLLALGHRLPELMANQQRAGWPKDRWERFSPRELRGGKVGIVGYGSIGRQVARLLQPFGAEVLATKRDARHPEDTGYTPQGLGDPAGDFVRRLYPPQALRDMLRECDFVVIAVPLSLATQNLIGAREFAAMKTGAYLVDISRGGVVDHAALHEALHNRKIAGAALDVFPEEPLPEDNPLWKMPQVILTPHIAGVTPHYDERALALFAENLRRYLADQPLYNYFDPKRGY